MLTRLSFFQNDRKELLLGSLLFGAAFLSRALLADTARFTFDEASFFEIAHRTYLGEIFPLLGSPVTAGQAKMPGSLFFLLMSLSQFLSPTPEAVNIFTAFLKSIGILFIWRALRYRFNQKASFLTAIFMACAPWSILYSDRIWNSNLIGFFVALAFWSSISLRHEFKNWKLILVMISCGVMPQIHLSAPIVWAPIMVIIWPTRRYWNVKNLSLGFLGTLFFYTPYLYSELQTNFENFRLIFSESIQKKRSLSPFLKVPANLINFLTLNTTYHELGGYWHNLSERKIIQALIHGSSARPYNLFRLATLVSSFILVGWLLLFSFKKFLKHLKNKHPLNFFAIALITGGIANALFLVWTGKKVFPHYIQPLMPFTLFLLAYFIEKNEHSRNKSYLLNILLGLFCLGGLESSWNISKNKDAKNSLKIQKAVIEAIHRDIPRNQSSVYIHFDFFSSPESYTVLSKYFYKKNLHFQDKNSPYQYRLTDKLIPIDRAKKLLNQGSVSLYRLEE